MEDTSTHWNGKLVRNSYSDVTIEIAEVSDTTGSESNSLF